MINIKNLIFGYGGQSIYNGLDIFIKKGQRTGIVGRNGSGKSTLLSLLTGSLRAESGIIDFAGDLNMQLFSQDLFEEQNNKDTLDLMAEADVYYTELEDKIKKIRSVGEENLTEADYLKLAEVESDFYQLLDPKIEAAKILNGLGFSGVEMKLPFQELSGGKKMRALLGKCLLGKPDLLLLDEPTNHLDLPSINWLGSYLTKQGQSIIVVSHDIAFLDAACTQIAYLEHQKLRLINGNFTESQIRKLEEEELLERQFKNQESKRKQEEKFIERFRYKASKAKAVQARIKLMAGRDMISIEKSSGRAPNIKFRKGDRAGKIVCHFDNLNKSYDDHFLFRSNKIDIERGDHVVLVGPNGIGKSSLLNMIDGSTKFEGTIEPGYNVQISFYAQHQLERLNPNQNLLEEMLMNFPEISENEARSILGAFLFSGDEVRKKIKVLSGGERSRLSLAKVITERANFLLLDEPTNHLDFIATENLADALDQYEDTFLLVSHNKDFLRSVGKKVLYFEDRELKMYPGTFAEFEKTPVYQEQFETILQKTDGKEKKGKKKNKLDYNEQKKVKKEITSLRSKVRKAEAEIEKLEAEQKALGVQMADPNLSQQFEKLEALNFMNKSLEKSLAAANSKWDELVVQLEKLEGAL